MKPHLLHTMHDDTVQECDCDDIGMTIMKVYALTDLDGIRELYDTKSAAEHALSEEQGEPYLMVHEWEVKESCPCGFTRGTCHDCN